MIYFEGGWIDDVTGYGGDYDGGWVYKRYYTGDIGRITADGDVIIEGRGDEQVKVNGVRFNLSEVEVAAGDVGWEVKAVHERGRKSVDCYVRLEAEEETGWGDGVAGDVLRKVWSLKGNGRVPLGRVLTCR